MHHCGGAVRADVGVYPPLAEQAGLANREAILPSGEPIIRSFVENRSELRYNTSPQRSFAQIPGISPVRPPTHGAMRRAFKLLTFKKKKNRQRKTGNKTRFVLLYSFGKYMVK
ncbi:MAG: hypothetical protein UW64_C0006G0057 [Microgenomates group bacterium GW2011_GWC1_44_37]|uniref:Uncharacterized protein n=1 Tax=Candidatus Collierbacteria bacterium GW2011_GWB2_44_22 TaxID=1618387 RepID=A0A0G1HYW9_9BACT|nr:MAG: hypothetical protein UW31_C0015G0017 [Candidatus Collierbacteria bacterium GW2011_GWA2_44_13]KKT52125.1 MAG: hypothetical protein UW44_C0004G0030 [Candidatus Collierbacteria bacterium GW2011_GWB2_44_22]KKT69001.1 MAG: hypothetical protein UW64_C0006G0057 [Microgenomates group bacterium GW2011_GWC1_44_37]